MKWLVLIAALVLLPAQVLAECAWVLWQQQSYRIALRDEWTPVYAYPTFPGCEEELRAKVAGWLKEGATALAPNVVKFEAGALLTARVLCLPDTVDPREPRGELTD